MSKGSEKTKTVTQKCEEPKNTARESIAEHNRVTQERQRIQSELSDSLVANRENLLGSE